MKKLPIKTKLTQAESVPVTPRPVVLSLSELRRRETALADFLKINGDTIRLLDECEGIFTPADDCEVYWVTPDEIKESKLLGEKYGYRIYESEPL